jgi:hypothetical protein
MWYCIMVFPVLFKLLGAGIFIKLFFTMFCSNFNGLYGSQNAEVSYRRSKYRSEKNKTVHFIY